MTYTPLSNLTDNELLRMGMFQDQPLTDLEIELLTRLEKRIHDDDAYTELDGVRDMRGVTELTS